MSIQRTAQSVLHVLEDLYRIIDASCQQQGHLNLYESENLLQSLCTLSQLINHVQQTNMCGQISSTMSECDFQHTYRDYPLGSHFINPMPIDATMMGMGGHSPGHSYGEYVLYQPVRMLPTGPYVPSSVPERQFDRKEMLRSKPRRHHRRSSSSESQMK